ncbi:MAG: hypothetical protein MUC49_10720 [Raineya sp.]|jgi:hypothetical protein|nr:hypothetical protein [Raineya sp.]
MRTICLLLCFGLFAHMSTAQKLIMDILDPTGANQNMRSGVSRSEVVASVYLTDWQEGYVMYGQKKEKKIMRYNAYKDALHIKDANNKEVIIQEGQVERFIIVDKNVEYNFRWLNNIPKINFGYVQIIYENQVQLYYRHQRRLKQTVSGTEGYLPNIENDALVEDNSFVIVLPNGITHITKAKKKDVLNIFSDKKTDLEAFIKTEKIDTQTLKGLMKVIEKYEELLKK